MTDAAEIRRLRHSLTERYDAYGRQQARLNHCLSEILELGRKGTGNASDDLAQLIGRIADFRAGMGVNFSAESQALSAVEAALLGIRARLIEDTR